MTNTAHKMTDGEHTRSPVADGQKDHWQRIYEHPGVVSPAVCRAYIDRSERACWHKSNIRELNPAYSREQSSITIDVDELFGEICPCAPRVLDNMTIASLVRARTVCMRYSPGEYFGPHTDAPFRANDQSVTKLSMVLYLNDDYSGGKTSFPDISLDVRPEVGKVLLFAPDLRHMSQTVLSGVKYIVRSEVLYRSQ